MFPERHAFVSASESPSYVAQGYSNMRVKFYKTTIPWTVNMQCSQAKLWYSDKSVAMELWMPMKLAAATGKATGSIHGRLAFRELFIKHFLFFKIILI